MCENRHHILLSWGNWDELHCCEIHTGEMSAIWERICSEAMSDSIKHVPDTECLSKDILNCVSMLVIWAYDEKYAGFVFWKHASVKHPHIFLPSLGDRRQKKERERVVCLKEGGGGYIQICILFLVTCTADFMVMNVKASYCVNTVSTVSLA